MQRSSTLCFVPKSSAILDVRQGLQSAACAATLTVCQAITARTAVLRSLSKMESPTSEAPKLLHGRRSAHSGTACGRRPRPWRCSAAASDHAVHGRKAANHPQPHPPAAEASAAPRGPDQVEGGATPVAQLDELLLSAAAALLLAESSFAAPAAAMDGLEGHTGQLAHHHTQMVWQVRRSRYRSRSTARTALGRRRGLAYVARWP